MDIVSQVKGLPGAIQPERGSAHSAGPTLEVIGLGLPRCGTSSLHAAFEGPILDCGPALHMKRIVPSTEAQQLVLDAMREPDRARRHKILKELCAGCRSAIDWPVFFFADDLMDLYPDARLVLNLRPGQPGDRAASWSRSIHGALAWFASDFYRVVGVFFRTFRIHYRMSAESYNCLAQPRLALVQDGQGSRFDWATADFYERYLDWVRAEARKRGRTVLEFEPSMGWGPLCEFLGREAPQDGLSFPHLNDAKEMTSLKRVIVTVGLASWLLVGGGLYAAFRYGPALAHWVWGS